MQSVNLPNGFGVSFLIFHMWVVCSLFTGSVVAWQAEDPNIEAHHKAKQNQNKSCLADGSHDSRQKSGDLLLFLTNVFCVLPVARPRVCNKKSWSLSS